MGAKGKVLIKIVRFLSTGQLLLAANGIQRKMNFGMVGLHSVQGEQLWEVMVDKGPLKSMSVAFDEQSIVVGLMAGKKVICKLPQLTVQSTTKELHSLPAQCVAWVGQSTALSVSGDRDIHLLTIKASSGGMAVGFIIQMLLVLVLVAYQLYRIGLIG